MKFERALEALRQGKKIRRKHWENQDLCWTLGRDGDIVSHSKSFFTGQWIDEPAYMGRNLLADDWYVLPETYEEQCEALASEILGQLNSLSERFNDAAKFAKEMLSGGGSWVEKMQAISQRLKELGIGEIHNAI